jgi:hypothetical protein
VEVVVVAQMEVDLDFVLVVAVHLPDPVRRPSDPVLHFPLGVADRHVVYLYFALFLVRGQPIGLSPDLVLKSPIRVVLHKSEQKGRGLLKSTLDNGNSWLARVLVRRPRRNVCFKRSHDMSTSFYRLLTFDAAINQGTDAIAVHALPMVLLGFYHH